MKSFTNIKTGFKQIFSLKGNLKDSQIVSIGILYIIYYFII